MERYNLWKVDGFFGRQVFERRSMGPDAGLVYDDGSSILRVGYSYRKAFDGAMHAVSTSVRSNILQSDTVAEIFYRHRRQGIHLGQKDLLPVLPLDDNKIVDMFQAAIEQGFLPGINVRLEVAGLLESGHLESPYRLVTLWPHRAFQGDMPTQTPMSRPETHPDSRVRFGSTLRARFALSSWSSVLEVSLGHGFGTWRVEHSKARLAWLQRLGDVLAYRFGVAFIHQTRASFYQDDYRHGPTGEYWSADISLSSQTAWLADLELNFTWIPQQGRYLGIFRSLRLRWGLAASFSDNSPDGLSSQTGFSVYPALAGNDGRRYDSRLRMESWLSVAGYF
jgi:hypothetical protein